MTAGRALRCLLAVGLLIAAGCSTGTVIDNVPLEDAAVIVDDLSKKPWDDHETLPDDTGLGLSSVCGDGRTDPDEACDPGDESTPPPTCADLDTAFAGGVVGCLPSCQFDVSSCTYRPTGPSSPSRTRSTSASAAGRSCDRSKTCSPSWTACAPSFE